MALEARFQEFKNLANKDFAILLENLNALIHYNSSLGGTPKFDASSLKPLLQV